MMKKTMMIGAAMLLTAALIGPFGTRAETKDGGQTDESALARFTPEQRAKLLAGEPVYELVENKDGGETRGHGESYALIDAPVADCWKIFTEFDKQQLYFPRKTKSEVLKREGNTVWVHKEFDFYVTTIQYTMIYTVDEVGRRVDFQMDPSYPHDLKDSAGYFLFTPYSDKRTLFTYAATKVETGVQVPKMIQDYLTSRDLPDVVVNVKKRVESGGTWTKE